MIDVDNGTGLPVVPSVTNTLKLFPTLIPHFPYPSLFINQTYGSKVLARTGPSFS